MTPSIGAMVDLSLPNRTSLGYRAFKRSFDVVFSSLVLLAFAPLLAVIALWIRLDSAGPVFFRQSRIGRYGRPFTILKFRTMSVEADPYAKTPSDDGLDPRVTRIGRHLRRSGLDEIPQFWNVLRGDMSVVGPRPEMPFIVERYTREQRRRLLVLPGITGPWQVSPARRDPIHEHLEYDFGYIANQSVWLDLYVVWQTFWLTARALARVIPGRRAPAACPEVCAAANTRRSA